MAAHKRQAGSVDPDVVSRIDAELEDDLGRDVPDAEARRALAGRPPTGATVVLRANWALVVVTLATAIVVGAIISLVVGSWWILALAVVVHGIATAIVVATIFRLAGEDDKPDPATVADLEAHGVSDPEGRINDALHRIRSEERPR